MVSVKFQITRRDIEQKQIRHCSYEVTSSMGTDVAVHSMGHMAGIYCTETLYRVS